MTDRERRMVILTLSPQVMIRFGRANVPQSLWGIWYAANAAAWDRIIESTRIKGAA